MNRILLLVVLVPMVGVLVWLAADPRARRADFVLDTLEPRTLDPQRVSWLPEIQLAAAMFEGLTRLNPETFQPEPAVAERWNVSADQRRYVFHLRPTARWSTGEPVVAEDFRFAWLRAIDPAASAQYASLFFVIDGAEAYYRSRLNDTPDDDRPASSVGIAVDDEATLTVTLANPCPYFLDLTSFITFTPSHRPTLDRWAYRDGQVLRSTQHLWTRPENIVCNGAFVLEHWAFKERIWLRRNRHYWDGANIHVDTIEAYSQDNPNAALIAYKTGRIDHLRGVERNVAEVLLAEQQAGERSDFYTGDRFATFFFRVNCQRPPLDNADLRKALTLAIDRPALCTHVLRLGETPAWTFVPRTVLDQMPRADEAGNTIYYEPPDGLDTDLSDAERIDLARAHLAQSGFAGERPLEIAFASTDPEQRALAEAIQAMWIEALGLPIMLKAVEGKVLSTRIRNLDYDVARSNWFGDYMDPSTFLDMFTTASGQNRTGWSHPEYDRLIAAAASTPDNARRFDLFRAAERILCEDEVPILTVFYRRGNYLLSPRFTGLNNNVRDLLPIHRVRMIRP